MASRVPATENAAMSASSGTTSTQLSRAACTAHVASTMPSVIAGSRYRSSDGAFTLNWNTTDGGIAPRIMTAIIVASRSAPGRPSVAGSVRRRSTNRAMTSTPTTDATASRALHGCADQDRAVAQEGDVAHAGEREPVGEVRHPPPEALVADDDRDEGDRAAGEADQPAPAEGPNDAGHAAGQADRDRHREEPDVHDLAERQLPREVGEVAHRLVAEGRDEVRLVLGHAVDELQPGPVGEDDETRDQRDLHEQRRSRRGRTGGDDRRRGR